MVGTHRQLHHRKIAGLIRRTQIGRGLSSASIRPFKRIRAFKGFVQTYKHNCSSTIGSLDSYFLKFRSKIETVIKRALDELKCLKSQMTLVVKFKRFLCESKDGDVYEFQERMINSNMIIVLNQFRSLDRYLKLCAAKIEHTVSIFEQYGSGWQFDSVLGCHLRIGKLKPFTAGSWMNLPQELRFKRAIINIKTMGNACFKWAVLGCLHKPKNPDRASSYTPFEHNYDFNCVAFPVSLSSIPKFEEANKLTVNVFRFHREEGLIPVQISEKNYSDQPTVNLLLVLNPASHEGHYASIRNIDKLLGADNHHRKVLCYNCLHRVPLCKMKCGSPNCDQYCVFRLHSEKCQKFDFQKVKMPKPNHHGVAPTISFENFPNQMKGGYCMYADIECLLRPIKKVIASKRKSNTVKNVRHTPTGFAYAVVKEDMTLVTHRVYRGKGAIAKFLKDFLRIAQRIMDIYEVNVPLVMSEEDELTYGQATECHICKRPFTSQDRKCRDHNHLTGETFRNILLSHTEN